MFASDVICPSWRSSGVVTPETIVSALAPGRIVDTTIVGESVALHRGRTTMVWQTTIRSAEGKLCAVVTQTQLVMDA